MSDISYGQLVVISGVNVDNDIITASQHAIAYATGEGMLVNEPITGLSAETFAFSRNVDINNNLLLGGNLDLPGKISLNGINTVDRVLIIDSNKDISASNITTTELNTLNNVTSNIQEQLSLLAPKQGPIFSGTVTINNNTNIGQNILISGTANILSSLSVAGSVGVGGNFDVNTDKFTVNSSTGNTAIAGNLDINTDKFTVNSSTGNTAIAGNLDINTDKFTVNASTGNTAIAGNLDINSDKFTVNASTGNTTIAGDLLINNGQTSCNSLLVQDSTNLLGNLDISGSKFTVSANTGDVKTKGSLGVSGSVDVSGATRLHDTVYIENGTTLNSTLDVLGNTGIDGNFDVGTDKFIVDVNTGNTTIGGMLIGPPLFYIDPAPINNDAGKIIIRGNLQVDGSMTTINSTTIDVSDLTIKLAHNSGDRTQSNGAGIEVNNGGSFIYDGSNNIWKLDIGEDISGILTVKDNTNLLGRLNLSNAANLDSTLDVSGATHLSSTLDISGDTFIDSSLVIIGNLGIQTSNPYCSLDISTNDALKIPVGTTSQRPALLKTGQIRYNTTTSQFEGYNNTQSWQGLGGVVDIDQDTKILAETNPLDDNDEIQIYTASHERMRVDACGNIQMKNSDPTFVALDINATSGILLPKGRTAERPIGGTNTIRSDISGAIRFNTDTSLCEIYTLSDIWSGLPLYKTEQPPKLKNVSQNKSSESVSVSWNKFDQIYKDAFDGKSYPIYLQTFVDISYTNVNGLNSTGWKTILIGNGNYNLSGVSTTPLTNINFNSVLQTTSSNNTGYTLNFIDKPSTINLPTFTQDDLFDLRIYGINNSETKPNYVYINNVGLQTTGVPGAVDITNTHTFRKDNLEMDLSFNLDSTNLTIISGISIVHYDISFTLSETKSLVSRTHEGNQYKHWSNSISLSKNNINLIGLYPGAKYDIQVRAKNALKLNDGGGSDGPTPTHIYKYGNFGNTEKTTGFTNNQFIDNGTNTTMYVDSGDLASVYPTGMSISLNGSSSINCMVNGTAYRSNRTILSSFNSNSYINLSNISEFYINYGKQGYDMSDNDNTLVSAIFNIKNSNGTDNKTISYKRNGLVSSDTVSLGTYQFTSSGTYTDKGNLSYNKGFVYSSSFSCTNGNSSNSIFDANFTPSINNYYLNYQVATTSNNNNQRIDHNGTTSTTLQQTYDFYVDDYNSYPNITWIVDPLITITSFVYLFGIPSIREIRAVAQFNISNYANNIIPYNSNRHSRVSSINDKNSYSFTYLDKTDIYVNTGYDQIYDKSSTISSNSYDATTISTFTISIFYLNNSGTPTVDTSVNNLKEFNNVGKIFRDLNDVYSGLNLYTFNGTNSIGSLITTNSSTFSTTYASNISSMLLYFNNKFVSGGFSTTYDNSNIQPFSDWSTGYATQGVNYLQYNNTGIGGYKWIAIDVTTKKSGNSVDLSNFLINGSSPDLSKFSNTSHIDGYEAYISHDNKFGALKAIFNSSALLWFDSNETNNTSISGAKSINPAINVDGTNAYVDESTSSSIYLIVGLNQNMNAYFTFS